MADNPQALMAVSLGLILFCVIVIALFIIFVHTMPGKIAEKRGNPQAEAIEILSLLGLLIFPLWMAALVWAYMRPFHRAGAGRGAIATKDASRLPSPRQPRRLRSTNPKARSKPWNCWSQSPISAWSG